MLMTQQLWVVVIQSEENDGVVFYYSK